MTNPDIEALGADFVRATGVLVEFIKTQEGFDPDRFRELAHRRLDELPDQDYEMTRTVIQCCLSPAGPHGVVE